MFISGRGIKNTVYHVEQDYILNISNYGVIVNFYALQTAESLLLKTKKKYIMGKSAELQ